MAGKTDTDTRRPATVTAWPPQVTVPRVNTVASPRTRQANSSADATGVDHIAARVSRGTLYGDNSTLRPR